MSVPLMSSDFGPRAERRPRGRPDRVRSVSPGAGRTAVRSGAGERVAGVMEADDRGVGEFGRAGGLP